jgi:hypothetical protein
LTAITNEHPLPPAYSKIIAFWEPTTKNTLPAVE